MKTERLSTPALFDYMKNHTDFDKTTKEINNNN